MRALLILPLILYLILPTKNYYWDGVGMAVNIEKHAPLSILLFPSHLIYALCGSWLYAAAMALGIKTRALFLMQGANAVLGGLCVPLFHRALRGAAPSERLAGALALAFSATWWKFTTDANAYIPSIFFLLCAYLLLVEGGPVILAGLAHAMAMLFHELAILFLPAAWILLRARRGRSVEYAVYALVPVAAAYAAASRAVLGNFTVPGMLSWSISHSPDSGFDFNPLRDAALTLRGTLRLFFGGRLADFHGNLVSNLAIAGFAVSAVAFLWIVARGKAARWSNPPLAMIWWLGPYAAFLFFWMPQNTFYRLFYLAPLIALAVAARRPSPALALASVLFFWNLGFAIYPDSRPQSNAPLEFALSQRERWPPGTPIVFHRFHPDLWTISYFTPGTAWIGLDGPDAGALDRALEYARAQRQPLWIEADAYDTLAASPAGRPWLAEHQDPAGTIEYRDPKHDFRFYCAR